FLGLVVLGIALGPHQAILILLVNVAHQQVIILLVLGQGIGGVERQESREWNEQKPLHAMVVLVGPCTARSMPKVRTAPFQAENPHGAVLSRHMRIDIITVLPRLLDSYFNESILRRAQEQGIAEVHLHDLRAVSEDKHKRVDDYPFGGGAGMVMSIAPVHKAITWLRNERAYDEVIYMSPDGELLDQPLANRLSTLGNMIL